MVSQMMKLDTLSATSDTTDDTSERDCLRHVELGRGPAFLALNAQWPPVEYAVAGPLGASTCGGSHKPCRSFNVGVKGWTVDARG